MGVKKIAWIRPETNDFQISIITSPVQDGPDKNAQGVTMLLRHVKRRVTGVLRPMPAYLRSSFGGHHGVTRSLYEGLQKLNVPFSYDPKSVNDLSRTVVVLSNAQALKQMIRLKQLGYIKYLLAGPNILNDPAAYQGILAAPEVDLCITPCEIVCKLHERFLPSLSGRCLPWAAGVDTEFWKPGLEKGSNVLIYSKQNKGATVPPADYIKVLEQRGYTITIVSYGSYSIEEFRRQLQHAKLMIGFSRDESQGIAWAEAWACDVPTFIWQNTEAAYLGVQYNGSSAPYLTSENGAFFKSTDDFALLMDKWERNELNLAPRKWCLQNMTDEVCAEALLRLAKVI